MIGKQNGSNRRILAFPAVYPGDSIELSTFLTSLTDLALEIREFKHKPFSTNARNAREIIREVTNLAILLEEIRVGSWTDSLILGLSELHLTLQKIRYLLEDCTRDGARLSMVMNSSRVANHFRVFARALAVGLDVIPLWSMDVSAEIKELVELVIRQARTSRFEVDPHDQRVMDDVLLILRKFENGVVPDREDMKRVLDNIGVKTWSDCNKEVKLLDDEIELEYSLNEEKRGEVDVLSSLMGFVTYSRCVLFNTIEIEITQQQQQQQNDHELLRFLNGDDFLCPISLEVMKDPVVIETGHTYDKGSILRWFRSGNAMCPKTGKRLGSLELMPNLAVKRVIQQYCVQNGIPYSDQHRIRKNRDITRTVRAGSLAAEGAMKMVSHFLAGELANGNGEKRNKAAYEIRVLTKASIFNRSCLVEAGVVNYLLKLLVNRDCLCQENATAGLLNLSKHSISKAVIVENGGLELIVDVLMKGLCMEARQHAAATLFYLASIEDYRKLIGESTEAVPGLVQLIREGNDRARKNALVAIYGLLMHPNNHCRVLAAGAVPLLLTLLTACEREELATDCLAVLASLAEKPDGARLIICSGNLPQIMGILDSSTSRAAKEQCVCLLLALCISGGGDVVALLVKSASLIGSLYSLLSEGTSRASKKASALIRILHEFYESSSSSSKTPVLLGQFIHAW